MKIAIYETIHLDWVLPLCELFCLRQDEIWFLTNAAFEKTLIDVLQHQYTRFNWHYISADAPVLLHWKKMNAFFSITSFDCIILNSVEARHLLVYTALRKQNNRVLVNVHDVNNFFKPSFGPGFRQMIKTAGKKLLAKRADAFVVNAKFMKDYIELHNLSTKPFFWLAPVIEKARPPILSDCFPLKIVIPGSVDARRRDYATALNAIEKLAQSEIQAVKVFVAGRPVGTYGRMIIERIKQLQRNGVAIEYSNTEIEERRFQELIAGSNLILSPLQIHTSIHDNIPEQYGTTKASGNLYDAIRHGKPLVIPEGLVVPNEIKSSCLFYKNEQELYEALLQLMHNSSQLMQKMQQAYVNSKQFSLQNATQRLACVIEAQIH